MNPQHTFLFFDLRAMKAEAIHSITEMESGCVTLEQAVDQLEALADDVPRLDSRAFTRQLRGMLLLGNFGRAKLVVSCLKSRTLKPWAHNMLTGGRHVMKWGALLALVVLVARCAVTP